MKLINTHPVKKSDLGFHGNLFGGKLLSWIDASAAGFAMEFCESHKMVTLKIDECFFKKPAKEGQIIKIYADVKSIGTTSIDIYMEARSRDLSSGQVQVVLSTSLRFVRLNELGEPTPIDERVIEKFNNQE